MAVGAPSGSTGSTSDVLCLPDTPQYSSTVDGRQDQRSRLSLVEYGNDVLSSQEVVINQPMPCSVCMATGRNMQLVVPARNTCPSSEWTLEYSGYLMSAIKTQNRAATICVDESPQGIEWSGSDSDPAVFVHTEIRCLEDMCPEYTAGYELTCAVCTI